MSDTSANMSKQTSVEVNVDINTIDKVSIKDEKNTAIIQDFYNSIIDARVKFNNLGEGEKSDPKKGYNTFLDYFRSYLYKEKNTRFKLDTKTNIVILSKRYYEKDGFTLSFCAKTYNILDFKNSITKKCEELKSEMCNDIVSIKKSVEGTNIIVVIKDGKIVTVRTQGTFEGNTSYDTTDTHYELFFKTLDNVKFGLSKFFEISKAKPDIRFCFNFLMKLNFTPYPTFSENEIHLISCYEIKNKVSEFELFNKYLEELPLTDFEEKEEELKELVKSDLISSYINYFNNEDMISLFYNIGSGKLKVSELYDINPEKDTKTFIEDILTNQDALKGEKGIIIEYSNQTFIELENHKNKYIRSLRCPCSIVVTSDVERERQLFYELFLHLLYFKDNEMERGQMFQDFYQYYDSDARFDGKGGQFKELFRKFYKGIDDYSNRAFELYINNRVKKVLPGERVEIDKQIPPCFKFKSTNIVNIIHSYYQKEKEKEQSEQKKRSNFKVELKDVAINIVFETILKSKYNSYISEDPQEKYKDLWGDIYGKIMKPITEV